MTSTPEYLRELRRRHKTLGLCGECRNPVFMGAYLCPTCKAKRIQWKYELGNFYKVHIYEKHWRSEHREELAKYFKLRAAQLKREGRCIKCRVLLIEGERTCCVNCRTTHSGYKLKGVLKYATAN